MYATLPTVLFRLFGNFTGHGIVGCNPQIIYYFFHEMNLDIIPRYLVYTTPPTVFTNSFVTLQVLRSWSENVHTV